MPLPHFKLRRYPTLISLPMGALVAIAILIQATVSASSFAPSPPAIPNMAIAPQFGLAFSFHEGLAPVQISGKWGFINQSGKHIIEPQFDEVYRFSEGLALVRIGSKWGFIDKNGKHIIEPQFDSAASFSEGLAPVQIGNKWGYVRNPVSGVSNSCPAFNEVVYGNGNCQN